MRGRYLVLSVLLGTALVDGCAVAGGRLATGDHPCFTAGVGGELVVNFLGGGTQIRDTTAIGGGNTLDVVWPVGYTSRWSGVQLEVLSPDGVVKATTGQRVWLPGGGIGPGVFYACPA
jgi:hypothetical protein